MSENRSTVDVIRESRTLAYTIGAITLIAGVVLLAWPGRTVTVVARIGGVMLILTGLADLVDTVRNHRSGSYWGLLAVRGVLNLAFGLAMLFWPSPTISVLVWLVGLDFVLAAIVGLAVRGRMPEEYRSSMLVRSVVLIGLGLVLMIWPEFSVKFLAALTGAVLAVSGVVLLWSGYQIGKLKEAV